MGCVRWASLVAGLAVAAAPIAAAALWGTFNVLDNDDNPEAPAVPMTANLVTPPANAASFTLNSDGTFTSEMSYTDPAGGTMSREIAILLTLLAYKVALLAIGWLARERNRDGADYFLGGRSLGPMVAAISASASSSSAGC